MSDRLVYYYLSVPISGPILNFTHLQQLNSLLLLTNQHEPDRPT
jgi:hypothetical protein